MKLFDKINNHDWKKKQFRIAVCLSGQPRHWRIARENIKYFFEHDHHPENNLPVTTDYFIHTWDTNSWRFPKTGRDVFENKKHNDREDIIAAYRPKGFIQEEWYEGKYIRAWDPMFYSHSQSLMLKRSYEIDNNFEYDLVIKARLDTVYNPRTKFPLVGNTVLPGYCYNPVAISKFPSEFNYNNFDDVMFYGTSPTMDIVGDLYDTNKLNQSDEYVAANSASINLDTELWYGPGCLLYNHMIKIGIHPSVQVSFDYAVVRDTMLDLNPITDYDEMRKRWLEWYV